MTVTLDLPAIVWAIRDVIAAGVDETVNVYPFPVDSPMFPCVVVTPSPDWFQPHQAYRSESGGTMVVINFDVLVGGNQRPEDAWGMLYELVPQIIAALEADSATPGAGGALGGLIESLACTGEVSALSPGDTNAAVFAASIPVSVLARR